MQDINKHHEKQFEKFEQEVKEVLKRLKLPILLEDLIVSTIVIIHMEHVKEESDYIFDGIEELLEIDTGVGEQNR